MIASYRWYGQIKECISYLYDAHTVLRDIRDDTLVNSFSATNGISLDHFMRDHGNPNSPIYYTTAGPFESGDYQELSEEEIASLIAAEEEYFELRDLIALIAKKERGEIDTDLSEPINAFTAKYL